MVVLAEPDPDDMVRAIKKAISILPSINPEEMHNRVSSVSNPILAYLRVKNPFSKPLIFFLRVATR